MSGRAAQLRESVKHYVPGATRGYEAVVMSAARIRRASRHLRDRRRSAREVFSEIYAKGVWGGTPGAFYSGGGSDTEFAEPYCRYLQQFVSDSIGDRVTIVDLGCGDFRVGARLLEYLPSSNYIGVDVVPAVVAHNRTVHGPDDRVVFMCGDILTDELPAGDVCLVRQVFQHLSNAEIAAALARLGQYPHIFVTEQYPDDAIGVAPNRDKPHGPDVRADAKSAVHLDEPPFNVTDVHEVLRLPYRRLGTLRTFHIANRGTRAAL